MILQPFLETNVWLYTTCYSWSQHWNSSGWAFLSLFYWPDGQKDACLFWILLFWGGLSSPLVATTETHTHDLCVGNSCGVTQPIIVMSRCPTEHPGEDHTKWYGDVFGRCFFLQFVKVRCFSSNIYRIIERQLNRVYIIYILQRKTHSVCLRMLWQIWQLKLGIHP